MQASQLTAKAAIQAFCSTLQLLGLPTLTAEAVRQSKFATAQVVPLWRVLHDLVLWQLAGGDAVQTAAAALSGLWTEVGQEQSLMAEDDSPEQPSTDIGQEGRDMVLCQLIAWGCPTTLVHRLQSGHTTSRQLLLVLVWLSARFNIFDKALKTLAMPADAALLLPPYPEDTRCSTTSQQYYASATRAASAQVSAAADHLQSLCQHAMDLAANNHRARPALTRSGLRPAAGRASPELFSNTDPGPEAEQQMWQAVDAAANMVASTMGRTRAALMSLQSHIDAITRLQDKVRTTQHSMWGGRTSTLSAFQLSLLQQPALLQQHYDALAAATKALQQQQQLVDRAQAFYLWAASVIQEEARAHPTNSNGCNGYLQEPRGPAANATQVPSALASLASLPTAGSQPATALLQRLQQQLNSTLKSAQPALALLSQRKAGSHPPAITAQHFRDLARAAVQPGSADAACDVHVADMTTATPTARHGSTPSSAKNGEGSNGAKPGWALPSDINAAMSAAQQAQELQEQQSSSGVRAQQLHRLGSVACSSVVALDRQTSGHELDATSEASRLVDLTLTVAKALAHTRSSNRQALSAAASALQEHFLVVGLT